MSRVSTTLANLPGEPVLLNDIDEEPAAVIGAPKARVIARWLVVVAVVVLLFGLVGWSYATSSELSSGIQVERTYQPTLKNIQEWEDDNNTFTCEGTAVADIFCMPALYAMHVLRGPASRATISRALHGESLHKALCCACLVASMLLLTSAGR